MNEENRAEEAPIILETVRITSQARGAGDAAVRRLRVLSAPAYVRRWILRGQDEIDGCDAAEVLVALAVNGHAFELRQGPLERLGMAAYLNHLDRSSARAAPSTSRFLLERE